MVYFISFTVEQLVRMSLFSNHFIRVCMYFFHIKRSLLLTIGLGKHLSIYIGRFFFLTEVLWVMYHGVLWTSCRG